MVRTKKEIDSRFTWQASPDIGVGYYTCMVLGHSVAYRVSWKGAEDWAQCQTVRFGRAGDDYLRNYFHLPQD